MAVRVAAARSLERPFFPAHVYVERTDGRVRVCDEDYLFCARLRQAGHRVVLHPGVRCGHYDRGSDAVAPASWEPPDRTNRRRVLARSGETFALLPLEEAPPAAAAERRVQADVVYIVTT